MSPRFHPFVRTLIAAVSTAFAVGLVSATIFVGVLASSIMQHRPLQGELEGYFANDTNKLVSMVLVYPFIFLVLLLCRHLMDRRSIASLGLRPRRAFRDAGFGAFCGALAVTFLFGILWVSGLVLIEGPSPEAFEAGAFASAGFLLLYAGLFVCVGFMEEISFRGYALHNLAAWLGWRGAVVLQGVVFAVIHPLNELGGDRAPMQVYWDARWALCNIFLIAVFFAQSYRKTGSLWFPIGFHFAWNFFLGCVWSLPVSGIKTFRLLDVVSSSDNTLSGGSFGAEGSIFLTFILAALIAVMHRMPNHPQATLDLALLTPDSPATETAEETDMEDEEERTEPSRFKTSMRPASEEPKLAPEFFQTAPAPSPAANGTPGTAPASSLQIDVSDEAFLSPAPAASVDANGLPVTAEQISAPPVMPAPTNPTSTSPSPPAETAPVAATENPIGLPVEPTTATPPAPLETEVPKPKKAPRW